MSALPPGGGGGSDSGDGGRKRGHRADGRKFKDGNTREDGSYKVGKGRTPESGKFRANDGRKRGKREKGSKNVATIWRKSLSRKHTIGGITLTALEWLIESTIRRGIARSDRAGEKALEAAERFERATDPKLGLTDQQILDAYMRELLGTVTGAVSDDADHPENGEPDASGDDHQGDDPEVTPDGGGRDDDQ